MYDMVEIDTGKVVDTVEPFLHRVGYYDLCIIYSSKEVLWCQQQIFVNFNFNFFSNIVLKYTLLSIQ